MHYWTCYLDAILCLTYPPKHLKHLNTIQLVGWSFKVSVFPNYKKLIISHLSQAYHKCWLAMKNVLWATFEIFIFRGEWNFVSAGQNNEKLHSKIQQQCCFSRNEVPITLDNRKIQMSDWQ